MTWRFIRRKLDLTITDWRQWWKEETSRIYEKRILKPETEIMRRTPWSRMRGQNCLNKELWETVCNGKLTGSVRKETIAVSVTISISVQIWHSRILLRVLSCDRMREMHREPEVREAKIPSGRMSRLPCKEYLKGTCTTPFCETWHPPERLFYKSENGCRFWEKCSHAHRQVDEQPSKMSQKNGDKSAVAMLNSTRQLGCALQDMEPPKSSSILRKSSNIRKPIRCVQFTRAVVRHANIRDQNPSLRMTCPGEPHQRSPNASKFQGRSQEETERQEQAAREAAWRLAQNDPKFLGET